jgi:hypothetical protein
VASNKQLIKRLRGEVTANPKKAAILGLLLIVMIIFWAPLVAKWVGKDEVAPNNAAPKANAAVTATSTVVTASASPNSTTTAGDNKQAPHWNEVIKWIHDDPRMQPHTPEDGTRDPFAPAPSQLAAQEQKAAAPAPPPPEISPAQAGIVLRSTVVGSRNKTALINNRAYHENQNVASPDGRNKFLLVEIRFDSVVLSRHGLQYVVKLRTVETATTDN